MQIFTLKILLLHLSYCRDSKIKFNVILKQTSINSITVHTWSKTCKDTWTVKDIEQSVMWLLPSCGTSIELQV